MPVKEEPRGFSIDIEYKPVYKWKTELPSDISKNIEVYRRKYEQFLRLHNNNTSNK